MSYTAVSNGYYGCKSKLDHLVGEYEVMLDVCCYGLPAGIWNCFNNQERKQKKDKIQSFTGLSAKGNRICWGKLLSVFISREAKVIHCLNKTAEMKACLQGFSNTRKQLIWAKPEVGKLPRWQNFVPRQLCPHENQMLVFTQLGKVFGSRQSMEPGDWVVCGGFPMQ